LIVAVKIIEKKDIKEYEMHDLVQ